MTRVQYLYLNREKARTRDAFIRATITSWPHYIPEWDEYAVRCLDGSIAYGETQSQCLKVKHESNEVWARSQAQTPIINKEPA